MLHAIQIVRVHTAQNITNDYLLRDSKHSVKICKQANVWEVIQVNIVSTSWTIVYFVVMTALLYAPKTPRSLERSVRTSYCWPIRKYSVETLNGTSKRQSSIMLSKEEWILNARRTMSDLHAVEARYHVDCRTKCFSNPAASGNVNETDIFLYDLVKLITSDRSKIWNSVGVHEAYRSLGRVTTLNYAVLFSISVIIQVHTYFFYPHLALHQL